MSFAFLFNFGVSFLKPKTRKRGRCPYYAGVTQEPGARRGKGPMLQGFVEEVICRKIL